MPASARCENLIGVMVLNVRISFSRTLAHTASHVHAVVLSLLCFLCPQFLLVRVFSPKISVVVVVILVIVVGVFDHSDVQTAVVVVFLATVVVVAKLLRFNRY